MHKDPHSAAQLAAAARAYIDEVTPAQARALVREGALWVDVRDTEERAAFEAMPDSVHLPRERWTVGTARLLPARHAPLVVYCAHGDRGALATLALAQRGYTQVVNLKGGLMALLLDDEPGRTGHTTRAA